jgi:hypothetical protein
MKKKRGQNDRSSLVNKLLLLLLLLPPPPPLVSIVLSIETGSYNTHTLWTLARRPDDSITQLPLHHPLRSLCLFIE